MAKAWDMCTDRGTAWSYEEGIKGSQWIYEALKDKYRILHYSGDTDGAVPTLGTMRWVGALDWPISKNWT